MVAGPGIPSPGEARTLSCGAKAGHAVSLQTSPQCRATDAEPPRRLRELAARVLQRVGDGLAFALGEREGSGRGKNGCFAEALRAVLERRKSRPQTLQPIADIAVLSVDYQARRRVGIQ